MKFDPSKHHRRSIRLKGHDYAGPGAYFLTLVTHQRECLFGEIVDGEMRLNEAGTIVAECWRAIPARFARAALDEADKKRPCVVMPNHLHGIILINEDSAAGKGEASAAGPGSTDDSTADASPLRPIGTRPGSLAAMVQNLKSTTSRRINALRDTIGAPVWQRNYYEHIVRDALELAHIRAYIRDNPAQWALDELRPGAPEGETQ